MLCRRRKQRGLTTAITIFSEKRKTLTLKTAWIIKKEQHISQPTNAEALIRTPEARLSMDAIPKNIINDPSEDVNRKLKNSFDKNNPNMGFALSDKKKTAVQGDPDKVVVSKAGTR